MYKRPRQGAFDVGERQRRRRHADGARLAASFEYRFHGDHALGGLRTSKEAMIRRWERAFRRPPGARFDVQDIVVDGGPWRTRAAVRSRVPGEPPGGVRYENPVFQFLTLVWGRVTSVDGIEDLQVLARALRAVADAGEPEALEAPITG